MTDDILNVLQRDEKVLCIPRGISMWPMLIHRRDAILIEKLTEKIKINDVVLFRRKSGQLVLHRVVGIKDGVYNIRGDNCPTGEIVRREQIYGILKGFYKGERYIDCRSDKKYLAYVLLCRCTHHIRIPIRVCFRFAKRVFRFIQRKLTNS